MCHLHPHTPSPHHHRRRFLKKSIALLSGALATVRPLALEAKKTILSRPEKVQPHATFDAHLHCPAESGELWQWHAVTRNFEEFVAYLDRTWVQRGIINSQRSQLKGTPAEFIAGNRRPESAVLGRAGR